MKIEVFGTGCCKCSDLYELVKSAAGQKGIEAEIIKITDMKEIVSRGIMRTPALAVDGKVVCAGRVPKQDEIENWIK